MADNSGKNQDNVARGLKATIHNDNVSEEAKQNAAQRLEQMGAEVPSDYTSGAQSGNDEYKPDSDDLSGNQSRGYKSTSSRGNASGQAKDNAEAIFDGDEPEAQFSPSEAEADLDYAPGESIGEDIQHGGETNRVLGGYKATLKNPRVSDQAKQHAQDMLDEAYN